jgi:hypothetical protein
MLRVRRRKDGSLSLSFPPSEALLLQTLPGQLRALLEDPDFTGQAVDRLFPHAYKDQEKEAEYRKLLGDDLRRRKLECIDVFEATLRESRTGLRGLEVIVKPEEFELWLGFVNDMRLVLGAKLDIQDEDWSLDFDPSAPGSQELALLHYLSWLEEELLRSAK